MKDRGISVRKNIRKIIIKSLIVLFVVIGVSLVAAGYFLKQGIHLTHFGLGPATISNCTLVWKQKLELQIDSIEFSEVEKSSSSKTDLKTVKRSLYAAQKFARLFSFASIADLSVGGRNIAVKLTQVTNREYLLSLQTEHIDFTSRLTFKTDSLVADIVEFDMQRFNSTATGQIRLEADSDQLTGTISALINEGFPVTVDFVGDGEQLSFAGMEAGPIFEIAPLVDLFGLSHNIQRWITDYLSGSRYHLNYFKGHFPWADPAVFLDTLEAEVRVDDTEYTFAQGLEPVKGEYTDLFFAKGVLTIKPHGGTFYGQGGGDSWVEINLNDPSNIILTAYIITDAVANDDIHTLLKHYGIPLPFKQVGGTTGMDLRLVINLNKLEIGAEGTFDIDEGLISYGGEVFKVRDAHILLKGSHVTLDQLTVAYKELFVAQIAGTISATDGIGDLNITLEQMNYETNESTLHLADSAGGAQATYHFDAQGHVLEAGPSSWLFNSTQIDVGPFRAPVYLDDLSLNLQSVRVGIPPAIQADISGSLSLKKKKAELACDLTKFHVKDLKLLSSNISVEIGYDQDWGFRTREPSHWSLNNLPITLYPLDVRLDNQFVKVAKSRIRYGSFVDSQISGQLDHHLKRGTFYLQRIDVTDTTLEKNLQIGEETLVELNSEGEGIVISVPELDLRISTDKDKNWSASFSDLSTIYSRSKLLQRFKIKAGFLTLSSENGKRPYKLSASIVSPYSLLLDEDGPVDELAITGKFGDHGITAIVNEGLHLDYADKQLMITSHDFAFNIPAFISLSNDLIQWSASKDGQNSGLWLTFDARNSHLYLSPKSKILADRIEVEYIHGTLGIELSHGPGRILLRVEDDNFVAEGSNLNDAFMGSLIQNSNFQGGQMYIAAMGSFDDFSAVFEIKDTVLINLKTVNNVMTLLNTVPALITFSRPEYDSTGLPLESAVVGMSFKDKLATFESIEFISPLLRGAGIGWIDFSERLMDLDVNLTTQRKINIRKIPLAGYILQGKRGEASITIKIKGGSDNPEVTHSLFREIIAKPFKVLFRVLGLPIHALQKLREESENRQQADQPIN